MENIRITIKAKGELLTVDQKDLIRGCLDSIQKIKQQNAKTSLDLMAGYDFEVLLSNYFTLKFVCVEFGIDITEEMAQIEGFIIEYFRLHFQVLDAENNDKLGEN